MFFPKVPCLIIFILQQVCSQCSQFVNAIEENLAGMQAAHVLPVGKHFCAARHKHCFALKYALLFTKVERTKPIEAPHAAGACQKYGGLQKGICKVFIILMKTVNLYSADILLSILSIFKYDLQ